MDAWLKTMRRCKRLLGICLQREGFIKGSRFRGSLLGGLGIAWRSCNQLGGFRGAAFFWRTTWPVRGEPTYQRSQLLSLSPAGSSKQGPNVSPPCKSSLPSLSLSPRRRVQLQKESPCMFGRDTIQTWMWRAHPPGEWRWGQRRRGFQRRWQTVRRKLRDLAVRTVRCMIE